MVVADALAVATHRHRLPTAHPNAIWMGMDGLLDGDGWAIGAHPSPSKLTLDGIALGFFSILDGRFQPMA